ncbi:MAG: hypothetical protein JXX29_23710 [Deltaproteobacteria bacterium]|nr:hypothetical protein [Deltaproteobacteria bacterium]MBN2674708.1 hypothetical protein [Deltaproteobacteria bacterium]
MKQLFSIVTAIAMIFLLTSCSSYWLRKLEKNAAGKPYDQRKMECLKTKLYTSNIPMTTEKAIIVFEIKNTCVTSQTIVLQQTPFKTSYFPFTSDQLFEVEDGHGKTVEYKGVYARAREAKQGLVESAS